MDQYTNRDGVVVSAEQVTEGEHEGFWHTVDANGVEGHVTDEDFQRVFSPVGTASDAPATSTKGKK